MCYNNNFLIMSGEVVNPPEKRMKQTNNGGTMTISRFRMKVGENKFLICKAFNTLADKLDALKTGSQVLCQGRLETTRYKDKNGVEQSLTEMVLSAVYPSVAGACVNVFHTAGRACKDGTFFIGNGEKKALIRTSMAVNRKLGDEEKAEFINVTAFDKKAEFLDKWIKKGAPFFAEGKLDIQHYTTKDGASATSYVLVANEVGFTSDKRAGSGSFEQNAAAPTADGFVPMDEGSFGGWADLPM